jgi:signal transduction histidine kinase
MDIKLTITRTGIFIGVYTLVLGLPFLLGIFGRKWLTELIGINWWLGPLFLITVLATVGPFAYIYFQKRAEALLLREQHRYQETLKQAARELARIHNLKRLLSLIVHIVTKAVRISHSAVYLFEEKSQKFILKANRNSRNGALAAIAKENPVVDWLQEQREPLVYEELGRKAQDSADPVFEKLQKDMKSLDANVIVPGFSRNRLLGFLVLGEKRSGDFYNSQDLNMFSVLGNQAALAIENALLYEHMEEQIKQRTAELVGIQKQLIQAEKLATVGTLAGGVAHEINNPLTAVLTNVQMLLAPDHTLDADSEESLQLIEEATKRCRTIVQKLMTYAKKPLDQAELTKINLLTVVHDVVTFLSYQLEQENIKLVSEGQEDKCWVIANKNELEQVLTNLILNAKDAMNNMKKGGTVYITVSRAQDWIVLEVRDEGCGIPPEVIPKIFDPFFSTKDVGKGMGLGLSICQSILEKHNGFINVRSEVNKGSVFTVKLPKAREMSQVTA